MTETEKKNFLPFLVNQTIDEKFYTKLLFTKLSVDSQYFFIK